MEEKNVTQQENDVSSEKKIERNGKKEKKSSALEKIISIIILIVCIAGLIYSGSKLLNWLRNNIKSNEVITKVNDIAGVPELTKDENPGAEFGLNFEALCAYNPDIIGWIRIPGTTINYSLVQSSDNEKYLRHSIDLTYNLFGWPFVDYRNSPDFTDKNTTIYGHNIVSGLMFADLANISNGLLGNDVEIDIYRKDYKLLRYKVFSAYVINPETYYTTNSFPTEEDYAQFLNTMQQRSTLKTNQTVGVDDTIITLQTCTTDAKQRIVVQAKLVSIEEMPR